MEKNLDTHKARVPDTQEFQRSECLIPKTLLISILRGHIPSLLSVPYTEYYLCSVYLCMKAPGQFLIRRQSTFMDGSHFVILYELLKRERKEGKLFKSCYLLWNPFFFFLSLCTAGKHRGAMVHPSHPSSKGNSAKVQK